MSFFFSLPMFSCQLFILQATMVVCSITKNIQTIQTGRPMRLLLLQTGSLFTFAREILPQTSVGGKPRFLHAFSFAIQKKLIALTSSQLITVSAKGFRKRSTNRKRTYASWRLRRMLPSYSAFAKNDIGHFGIGKQSISDSECPPTLFGTRT